MSSEAKGNAIFLAIFTKRIGKEASPKVIKLTARRKRGQSLLKWKNTINNSIYPYVRQTF